jgi:hypothetical protein
MDGHGYSLVENVNPTTVQSNAKSGEISQIDAWLRFTGKFS